ncbi:TIGR02444 family protein [Parvularcula marina]|uniref:TIGR02444 family protein n=1 Tax=Parvularcula marina TaxID=2292771 RepID=A0A371REL7_9PROT|nr:TIGR02444 family protein [Parvularcula marina]RFB03888.1 TIGR02444 family protein [Parvularcula marina]
MTPERAAEDFWEWSIEVYARPGMKDALLKLQDRHHLNVNLILWAIWAAQAGWKLDEEKIEELTRAVDQFTRYGIERLREVRRYLSSPKKGFSERDLGELRDELLDAEIKGERMVQTRLAELTATGAGERETMDLDDIMSAARTHFANIGPSLEKPVLLADSHGFAAAGELFEEVLQLALSEETA